MPPKKSAKTKNGNGGTLGIENELWEAVDKLRRQRHEARLVELLKIIGKNFVDKLK